MLFRSNTLGPGGITREPLLYLSCLIRQNQIQKARRVALAAMATLPAAEAARLAEGAAALSLAAPAPTVVDAAMPVSSETWPEQTRPRQRGPDPWHRR